MSSKITTRLSGNLEFCLSNQSDRQVIDGSHDMASVTYGHASGSFMEGNIAATVQSGFDAPMSSTRI